MSESTSEAIVLNARERRILGVMIEKALTTSTGYPMTLNGLVTGCNQKSNRVPQSHYVDNDIDDCLEKLQQRRLAVVCYPVGSRIEKWKQELTDLLELRGAEKAVLAELLLRGPQALGDLRARAARMVKIAGQAELEAILEALQARELPLVTCLSPGGFKRGARVTHTLYKPDELAAIRQNENCGEFQAGAAERAEPAVRPSASSDELSRRVETLEQEIKRLSQRLDQLEG